MPWRPLPRIVFAVAIYPFQPSSPADLPLELGDELYIIEQGGVDGSWYRGYLVAPPSLLAGLTSVKGQTLEARVFSGIFPRNCVEVREVLGDAEGRKALENAQRSSAITTNGTAGDPNLSPVSIDAADQKPFETDKGDDGDEVAKQISDIKASRKISQATIIKLGEDNNGAALVSPTQSIPLTPVSIAPRDPDAPKPAAPVPMLKIGDETPTSLSEPLVDEIASCLREWHSTNLHELLLARQYTTLENMSNIVSELDLARRQLLHNVLTADERDTLREETVWNLVRANKMLSGDVVVRDPQQRGRLLTGDDSAVELTKLQSEMSMLEGRPTPQADTVTLHHLLCEINAVSGTNSGPVTLATSLYSKAPGEGLKPLSEVYALNIPSPETFANDALSSKLKTLFTDLNGTDIGEGSSADTQLYVVIRVQTSAAARVNAPPRARSSNSGDGPHSRPSMGSSNAPTKGSLKGRRSMMWGSKSKEAHSPESTRDNSRRPPLSSSSNRSRDKPETSRETPVIRTTGVGIIEVGQILKQGKDVEQVITMWSPLGAHDEGDDSVDGLGELIPSLLYSPSGRYARSSQAARVHAHFYPFASPDADSLVRSNPTTLQGVTQTRRIGFPKAPTKPRSDIYLTLSRVVIPNDALLSHPHACHIPLSQVSGLQNIQLTLEIRNAAGARVEHCIFPSSNSQGLTAWRTTVADKGSSWDQIIRLNLPAEEVSGSHLVMSVADAPEFPFALSWMPLWDQQAFIRDGRHSLLLHAYDKHTSSMENGKGAYLQLPWSALGKNESTKDEAVTGPLATLVTETYLCSTEFSQDHVMLGLINWREQSPSRIMELLKRLVFVPEIEIVKQLSVVFDALFGILVDNAGNEEYEDVIFNDLVTVLGIVHDRRFNLGPLVDKYAEKQFNFPFATPCLIRSYIRLLSHSTDPMQSRNLRAAFKVGRHILKFIINARTQQKAKEEGIGITKVQSTFHKDLHSIFQSLEALMQNPAPILVGSKTLVVQHFHTWLPELTGALAKDEIIMLSLSFMNACKDVKGMLILYKLVLIQHYTRLSVFDSEAERKTLLSNTLDWLSPYWGDTEDVSDQYRDQVRLCSAIVAEQLKHPLPEMYAYMPHVTASYCLLEADGVDETDWLSMLFSKSFPFQLKPSKTKQRFDEGLVELAALIAAISTIPKPKALYLKHDKLATYVAHALDAHQSILSCEAYPETWFSLHIYHHRATMKSLGRLSRILIESFLPPPDEADAFDMELWRSFFTTLLKVVSSSALALETFPEQKRRAVWKICGDVREHGADLLRKCWEAIGWDTTQEEKDRYGLRKIGGFQVQYVPSLVSPIMELCLSVHEGLRHVAVEVLQTMIVSEWALNEDLTMLEAEIISSLDILFKSKNMSEGTTQKLFIAELLDRFESLEPSEDDALSIAVKDLVATIDELFELLVAANSGTITESLHTLKLMEFMKDMEKEDIFIRYVHELASGQAIAKNYTEAGMALQLHADLYEWDLRKTVPALSLPTFPEQSAFERKEALYFEIIQHFEDGKAWAHALACYKELAGHYEQTTLDFAKLGRTQASMAKIYDSIVREEKPFPRYFRVTFKGLGFPPSLRDKEYIFEASPSERMASFTDRMQRQYPAAQVMSSGEMVDMEGQFIRISSVSAHRDMDSPVYQRSKVPPSVREHLLVSVPGQFSTTSKRQTASPNVKEQWVEKTIFTTAEPFPNILRRSEIVSAEEVSLTPLQTAIERTWRKTQELLVLEKRAASGDDNNLSGLTEALSQLLDLRSDSTPCVALYRPFLEQHAKEESGEGEDELEDEDDMQSKPIDPLENALAVALIDHTLAIKRCLSLFSRPSYQATQAELTQRFEAAFAPELSSLTSRTDQNVPSNSGLLLDSRPMSLQRPPQSPPRARATSPEQELIRSTRIEHRDPSLDKTSSHRISIMNPFKRSNHAPSGSTATNATATLANHTSDTKHQQPETKLNGVRRSIVGMPTAKTEPDDDAASKHSRTTNRSRGGKSDANPKRRSWFGGGESHKHNTSVSAPAGSREDVNSLSSGQRQTVWPYDARNIAAKSQGSNDRPPTATTAASNNTGDLMRSQTVRSGKSERPKTSGSNHRSTRSVTANKVTYSGTEGIKGSVFKRFSLLKGSGKKNRAYDGGMAHGSGAIQPLREE